jgi:hypothetical protein
MTLSCPRQLAHHVVELREVDVLLAILGKSSDNSTAGPKKRSYDIVTSPKYSSGTSSGAPPVRL